MTDTVRTVDELINTLFAQGQLPRSITEQDVRDLIVSVSLETTDLSSLPRSSAGLGLGRLWIDSDKSLRMVTSVQPQNVVSFEQLGGLGGLFAQGLKAGVQTWTAGATLAGSGGLASSAIYRPGVSANLQGLGSLLAPPMQRMLASASFSGVGSISSAAVQRMRALRTIGGVGGLSADGQRLGNMVWAAGTNVTRQNSNLRWRSSLPSGNTTWVTTTGNTFKSSGKWYVELFCPVRNNDMRYGIANPSFNAANYLGVDANSWGIYDNWDGTGTDIYNGTSTYFSTVPPPGENGVVSVALDCDNWKWWARINGGAWSALAGGTQNPATNQGGMSIPSGLRTGGVAIAGSMNWGTDDYMDMYPTTATWIYTPPAGFSAM